MEVSLEVALRGYTTTYKIDADQSVVFYVCHDRKYLGVSPAGIFWDEDKNRAAPLASKQDAFKLIETYDRIAIRDGGLCGAFVVSTTNAIYYPPASPPHIAAIVAHITEYLNDPDSTPHEEAICRFLSNMIFDWRRNRASLDEMLQKTVRMRQILDAFEGRLVVLIGYPELYLGATEDLKEEEDVPPESSGADDPSAP